MVEVTFHGYSFILKKAFVNIETFKSVEDARLRASALGWAIVGVKNV